MNNLVSFLLLVLGVHAFQSSAFAADVVVTSIGQASDGMMVKVLMKKLDMDPDYDAVLSAENLGAQKVIVAVIGASSKGLGAVGISKEEENARGKTLLQAAKAKKIKVLVMHIGGDRRRGEMTDTFIQAVAGLADRLIVVKSGNLDGIFIKAKSPNAKLTEVETAQAAVPVLETTLKEWRGTQ